MYVFKNLRLFLFIILGTLLLRLEKMICSFYFNSTRVRHSVDITIR